MSGQRSVGGRAIAVLLTAAACASTSCGVGLDRFPLPAPSVGFGTYSLTATFANALNLPNKAKVRLSGADVGEVESMVARNYVAEVTMRINSAVQIPVGTMAELRSATPLGDVFVALTPPPVSTGKGVLQPGDTLPIAETKSAATIEDVLSTAALLVNGGAIANLTKVVNGLGAAVGGKGEHLGQFVDESTRLIQNLSDRSEAIKHALAQTDELSSVLAARQTSIDDAITAAGPALETIADNTDRVVDLVSRLNRITLQLAKFPSIRGVPSRSMMADLNQLSVDLNDAATAPGASLATFNLLFGPVIKLTNATAAHVNVDLADLALGAYPDLHHPGDPGSRGPTREDFRNMVGSITYELLRLRDKVWGPPSAPPGTVPPPNLVGPNPGSLQPAPPDPAPAGPPTNAAGTP